MSVVAIIQARLGSSRLPRKSLMDIGGKALLWHVIERVEAMAGIDRVVVAVPASDYQVFDDIWTDRCWSSRLVAEYDVLGRYALCASSLNATTVVRITGDCPLWDPHQGERVLALYRDRGVHYASNIAPGYRDGEDVEVFSLKALMRAHKDAASASDREHVTPWIRRNYRTATLQPEEIRSDVKTSVDTMADLERVRAMVAA